MEYTLTRSKRKTAAIYVRDGSVEVRAPLKMPKRDIDAFVASKEAWITDRLTKSQEQSELRESFALNYGNTVLYRGKEYPIVARNGDRIGFVKLSSRKGPIMKNKNPPLASKKLKDIFSVGNAPTLALEGQNLALMS